MTQAPPEPAAGHVNHGVRRRLSAAGKLIAPVTLSLLGSLAALLLFMTFRTEPDPLTKADITAAVATSLAKAAEAPALSTAVFQTILPSLVYIKTEGGGERGSGIGSGVIIRDDGTILTANHVVEGARAITVTFADGTEVRAEVVNAYPNDLAVLRPSRGPELIVPAVLGGGARVGDETFAVGNPLGLTASLSAGVISGLNRTIPRPRSGPELRNLIQFDAAVNPGSSGGPLLNRAGQVIGIVTALANPGNDSSFTGIGFAVPLGTGGGGPGGLPR